jgi:hypothetical protein
MLIVEIILSIVCFFRIATTITTSRKLVKIDRRICLFVYYIKLIDTKLWMKEGATLKEGLQLWMVQGRIRRGIRKNEGMFFFLHNNIKR